MLSCKMSIFITLFCIKSTLSGFSSGMIKPGMFEYSNINGWMKPAEAAKLCENDLQCGGFTFHGTLTHRMVYEVYFFHYVAAIYLDKDDFIGWDWTSFTVNRKFIALPGRISQETNIMQEVQTLYLKKYPENGVERCEKIDLCVALSQNEKGETFKLETVFLQNYTKDENWTTVVSLSTKANQIDDTDPLDLDLCCPEQPKIPFIKLGRQEVPMHITRVACNITPDHFHKHFVARRIPVILEDCVDQTLFSSQKENPPAFGDFTFDDILHTLFENANNLTHGSRPNVRQKIIKLMKTTNFNINYKIASKLKSVILSSKEKPENGSSWTHTMTPNDGKVKFESVLKMRKAKRIRTFLKLSSLVSNVECYDKFHDQKTGALKPGYEQCIILDGLWKPPPIPNDLYAATKYSNDLSWIIFSAKNTGSQLHVDPDLMGAWNLLLMGRKWWVVSQTNFPIEKIACKESCSPGSEDGSNTWPWFQHVLPQLKKRKFYGKPLIEFVQLPGDVLYLPQGMPHTIHNVDDNIAITENYLFTDALPDLVKAISADVINPWVPDWNETLAYHNIYMKHSSKDDRLKMRDMYKLMTKLTRRYSQVC